MPASPKAATPLPRVTIVRRGSVQVARRFFFGRRGFRRTLLLFLVLCAIYYFGFRKPRGQYDLSFIEDNDEDIVQRSDHARKSHRNARKALVHARLRKGQTRPPMTRSRDGLVRVGDWDGRHPLFELINDAEQEWKTLMDFRPSTLLEAYEAYLHSHGRPPPAAYAQAFGFLPSQCPIPSSEALYLYMPVPSPMIRRHQLGLEGSPMTITMVIRNGRAGGGAADDEDGLFYVRDISRQLMNLLLEIGEFLPDLRFTLSADYPRNPVSHKLKLDMDDLNRLGEKLDESYWDEESDGNGLYSFRGWLDACSLDDPINGIEIDENANNTLKFIHTSRPLSPCHHPSLMHLSDYLSGAPPNFGVLNPVFAFSRTAVNGDILIPRPESSPAVASKIPWGKKLSVLYWRGPATLGGSGDELVVPANRLMTLFNHSQGQPVPQHVLIPTDGDGFEVDEATATARLSTRIDLAFTSCGNRVGCGDMYNRYTFTHDTKTNWEGHKYVLDLESSAGRGTSFRQLLLSGSLVLRASLFEDYWVTQARPWVHYIPVQPDFSDLQTIILFFETHDHLARRIASAGLAMAKECFGRAGMRAGLTLVLGEYGRMWNQERAGADMELPQA